MLNKYSERSRLVTEIKDHCNELSNSKRNKSGKEIEDHHFRGINFTLPAIVSASYDFLYKIIAGRNYCWKSKINASKKKNIKNSNRNQNLNSK